MTEKVNYVVHTASESASSMGSRFSETGKAGMDKLSENETFSNAL